MENSDYSKKTVSYHHILRDILNDEFADLKFNEKNNIFSKYCLNKSTISYFPSHNYLFIIEREDEKNGPKFYLRSFSLDPKEKILKKDFHSNRHLIVLEDESSPFEIPNDICLEILDNSNYNETILLLYSETHVFGNKHKLSLNNF